MTLDSWGSFRKSSSSLAAQCADELWLLDMLAHVKSMWREAMGDPLRAAGAHFELELLRHAKLAERALSCVHATPSRIKSIRLHRDIPQCLRWLTLMLGTSGLGEIINAHPEFAPALDEVVFLDAKVAIHDDRSCTLILMLDELSDSLAGHPGMASAIAVRNPEPLFAGWSHSDCSNAFVRIGPSSDSRRLSYLRAMLSRPSNAPFCFPLDGLHELQSVLRALCGIQSTRYLMSTPLPMGCLSMDDESYDTCEALHRKLEAQFPKPESESLPARKAELPTAHAISPEQAHERWGEIQARREQAILDRASQASQDSPPGSRRL
jgi:hypothetical protein